MTTRTYTDNKWIQFTVNVTLKHVSKFGIDYERLGEFVLCAQSAQDARAIAGPHVKGSKRSIDTTRMVEVVGMVSVSREVLPLEAPALKSCREYASEIEELEVA
jgi:hypothetical protein